MHYIHSATKADVIKSVLVEFTGRKSDPLFLTHALMSLAHHFDFVGDFTLALEKVEQAITISPELVDLYVLKAKILKHSGKQKEASETWETARNLDLADRYLNSKSVKALLRLGEIEKAKEIVMLFSKDSQTSTKSNLTEMQCMWWEFELGNALAAKGDTEDALKVWNDTKKHFDDMTEDEFDFAFYCLRKMTLRAYVDFLKLQDRLKSHKYYTRTVQAIAAHA
jgi:peptide alpha-N-acetyltransferase